MPEHRYHTDPPASISPTAPVGNSPGPRPRHTHRARRSPPPIRPPHRSGTDPAPDLGTRFGQGAPPFGFVHRTGRKQPRPRPRPRHTLRARRPAPRIRPPHRSETAPAPDLGTHVEQGAHPSDSPVIAESGLSSPSGSLPLHSIAARRPSALFIPPTLQSPDGS